MSRKIKDCKLVRQKIIDKNNANNYNFYSLIYLFCPKIFYMLKLLRAKVFFSTEHLQRISKLFQDKHYLEILQMKSSNPSINDLKKNYYTLIKKYHSDNCHNDIQKAQTYEQISKIIIKAYHEIDKKLFKNGTQKQDTTIEDQICEELFGKKYQEVKYWMYEKGNEKAKQDFFSKLFLRTGKSTKNVNKTAGHYQDPFETTYRTTNTYQNNFNPNSNSSNTNTSKGQNSFVYYGIAGLLALSGMYFITKKFLQSKNAYQPSTNPSSSKVYKPITTEEIIKSQERKFQMKAQKAHKMVQLILRDHPPTLKIPYRQDPHIMKQLTQYSIAPDIHFYEVSPSYYSQPDQKQKIIKEGLNKQKAFQIKRIKNNTTMTLSLQAERALQNIYVKAKDVIKEIETTGKFTPPQVFIRFHGYIMFQIREKPISLRNYKDTEYLSLFDLYFDYYSAMFMKKDQYCQYLVGKDEIENFGWVHFNNRKCNPIYLKPGQKAAFFHSLRETYAEQKYKKIWGDFYRIYEDRWKQGGNSKQRS